MIKQIQKSKKYVQEISDDFDDEFKELIPDEEFRYKIINWWYEILKRERKYFIKLGKKDALNKIKTWAEEGEFEKEEDGVFINGYNQALEVLIIYLNKTINESK